MQRIKPIMLSRQEEYDLTVAWRDRRDEKARERLVLAFLPIVYKTLKRYPKTIAVSEDDLIQEGVSGLLEAIDRFDPDNGNGFDAFARWWVRARISEAAYRHSSVVRPPMVRELMRLHRQGERAFDVVSIDAPCGHQNRFDTDMTFADILASEEMPADEAVDFVNLDERIKSALDDLDPRERNIVVRRHFVTGERVQIGELGLELGISPQRVCQLEHKALRKFAEAIGGSWSKRG